jgi:hypothetical protein
MALIPDDNIYKGKPFSVWLDVANYFTEKFTGAINVSLFTLEGDFVVTVEEKAGLNLNANSHYANGLIFTTNNLDVDPGTYLLVVSHKWDGYAWELTGSTTNYLNPIKIIIQELPFQPDIYENNDELSRAYNLSALFTSNNLIINTIGSNTHVGTDYDFYKVTLNAGYDYKITARLQDAYSSIDGKEYSLDGVFSYSFDGVNWSDSYDDIIDSEIGIAGAKTLYFWVSPYFIGETGTYQFDISISRTEQVNVSISDILENSVKIYPNPASEYINIDLSNSVSNFKMINLFDSSGKLLYSKNLRQVPNQIERIPLIDFKNGTYLLKMDGINGNSFTKKVIVLK